MVEAPLGVSIVTFATMLFRFWLEPPDTVGGPEEGGTSSVIMKFNVFDSGNNEICFNGLLLLFNLSHCCSKLILFVGGVDSSSSEVKFAIHHFQASPRVSPRVSHVK